MYTGPSNLSKTVLLEQLVFVSNEASTLLFELYKLLSNNNGAPSAEAVDKFLRQDVALSKDRVDSAVEKMLYYIASSRIDLIDHKEFYINLALRYKAIMSLIESAVFNLLLLQRKAPEAGTGQIMGKVLELVKLSEETMYLLTQEIRRLVGTSSGSENTAKSLLKNIESTADKIKMNERIADEVYRELQERIVDEHAGNPIAVMLLRDFVNNIENIFDTIVDQTTDILILARSIVA